MDSGNSLYGLVLAGGQSSRMGQDKSELLWHDRPLYQHMTDLLTQAGIGQVLISSNHLLGQIFVADRIPGRGPLSGIHAALHQVNDGDSLLVIPVDMPLLPVPALQQLAQQQCICCYRDYTLPLLLPVTAELREQVEHSIHSDNRRDYSLWRLLQSLQGTTITLPDTMAAAFSNANTPEDWQQCQTLKDQTWS